jgi:hypothetical protein
MPLNIRCSNENGPEGQNPEVDQLVTMENYEPESR